MFDGFTLARIRVGEIVLRVRYGGTGPPVLLLHGHPRTHTTWHRVAPLLARGHTVVCPDLRGYGQSSKPATTPDHVPYSKRAMAQDCVDLMATLGHERFAVAGHDRGCYVAFRTAMDHPATVERLIVMDGVPIVDALDRCDARFATEWWHWFFLAQTAKPADVFINAMPDAWYTGDPDRMGAGNHADWLRATRDAATVWAMCEDCRAGPTVDLAHDRADRATGRRLRCPTLFLRSRDDDMESLYSDPVAVWRTWGDDVRGAVIPSGHHMAEEAPEAVAAELRRFLSDRR